MNDLNLNKQKITWEAWEFKAQEKSLFWYVGFGGIAIALIVYAWYSHNFLTMITFLVISAAWLLYALQKPRRVSHELSTTGIRINQTFFPYRNIKNFWIIYNNHNKTLNFETTAYLNNHISLELGQLHPNEIKTFLKTYLQEDLDKEDSLTDVIARKVKF